MSQRLPASVIVSVGFHGGALAAAMFLMRAAPHEAGKVVEGVDLLVQTPKSQAAVAVKPPPLSTLDFLKLALPTVPRAAAPAELQAALPQHHAALNEPKLQDDAHKDRMAKLDALDLNAHRANDAARLDAAIQTRQRAASTLAAMPALEDVGQRRVKNLPEALALDDRRREAVSQVGLDAAAPAPSRRQALAAARALEDAAPAATGSERHGLSSVLPERPLLEDHPAAAPALKIAEPAEAPPPKAKPKPLEAAAEAPKKGVEIEGPLKDRRIVSFAVPSFPDWAKNQGILEADVGIRFTVDESGAVMPGMRIVSSSSYTRFDQLALDSLKSWRFEPMPGAGVQWGVITFRFVLE